MCKFLLAMPRVVNLFVVVLCVLCVGQVQAATIGTFTGGDLSEGLDLEGYFVYAVDVGSNDTGAPAGPDRPVGEAVFQDNYSNGNLIPGTAPGWDGLNNWGTVPSLGTSANDDNLEAVLYDIGIPYSHANGPRLADSFEVVPGQKYKLQMILSENHYSGTNNGGQTREQDIVIYDGIYGYPDGTGQTVLDSVSNLNVTNLTGGWTGAPDKGAVVTSEFTALTNWVTLSTHAPATPTGGLDTTPIFNAATLEAIPDPAVLSVLRNASELDASWPLYAVNVSSDTVVRNVNGLNFYPSDALGGVPGVTVYSNAAANNWGTKPNLGATAGDDALEDILHDIRYSNNSSVNIDATVGNGLYEVQLLFSENFHSVVGSRTFDIVVEGEMLYDEFDVLAAAGGQSKPLLLTYEVRMSDGNLDIDLLLGSSAGDGNPIINGLVIRPVPEPVSWGFAGLCLLGCVVTRRRRKR